MSIRIDCPEEKYETVWIDFREDGWPFKDRRRILQSVSDVDTLEIILSYIEGWHMLDVYGNEIPWDPGRGVEILDELDDGIIIPWLIGAWFRAKSERASISKKRSDRPQEPS
jgi:hypothetical protein